MPKSKNVFKRFIIIDDLLHRIGDGFYIQTELFDKLNDALEDRGLAKISIKTFKMILMICFMAN
jgi:hypothetical protein